MSNQRTRFIFDNLPIRGIHIHAEEVWQHIISRKQYPIAICRALGELLAAGALLSSNLKLDGTLIVQVQGQGVLKLLVVEATSEQTLRATARWDENATVPDDASLNDLLGNQGVFVMTLQPKDGEQWQGVVPLEGDSISQMLMNYMARSEQLDTYLVLASDENSVGGLLLQKLPENDLNHNDWQHFVKLSETLTAPELLHLDAQNILYRLFHETPPRVFEPEMLEFACTCSRGKVSDMLLLLGGQEVGEALAQEGSVSIDCDFCHEKYTFDEQDLQALFGMDLLAALQLNQKTIQ